MLFSVIYSVDTTRDERIGRYLPTQRHLFTQTEGNDQYDYEYLADGDNESPWHKGKHRKLCALLTKKQFERFLEDTRLCAEDCETMGSIGAFGFGLGWSPAIHFYAEEYSAIVDASVTPIPIANKPKDLETLEREFTERDWDRVSRAVINRYRHGV